MKIVKHNKQDEIEQDNKININIEIFRGNTKFTDIKNFRQ